MKLGAIGELQAFNAADSLTLRATVRQIIWGGAQFVLPQLYSALPGEEGVTNLTQILGRSPHYAEQPVFVWNAGGVAGALGIVAKLHLSVFPESSKLAIVHAGHNQGFFQPQCQCPADFAALISALAAADCDVLLCCMPWMGHNGGFHTLSDPALASLLPGGYHWQLGTGVAQGNNLVGSRLRYFIDPVIAGLERAMVKRQDIGAALGKPQTYNKIALIGHSGGGWTTTLAAAMDPRITHSYAISGSVPFGHRALGEGTMDWEQLDGIYELGVDYHDLYLMAAAETNRKARLLHNGGDTNFKPSQVNGFAWPLVQIARAGGYGDFRILLDQDSPQHEISTLQREFIISEFCA